MKIQNSTKISEIKKTNELRNIVKCLICCILIVGFTTCRSSQLAEKQYESITSKANASGRALKIVFECGKFHNHPTFAVWIEDMDENYIETLFVTKSLANGVFEHGEYEKGKWKKSSGAVSRPATLPYWLHKYSNTKIEGASLPSPENPLPDAITGATPLKNFNLETKTENVENKKFRILVEVNQTWDFNEHWTSSRFPDNFEYKTSCQPALVYAVTIDRQAADKQYFLNPIGHSHYDGSDGRLYTDLSSFTTALEIFEKIYVIVE